MSEEKKTVKPGEARLVRHFIDASYETVFSAGHSEVVCIPCDDDSPVLHLSYPELQTVIGEYYTLVPVVKPERWVVKIEDCLRPWRTGHVLGPLDTEGAAKAAAVNWAVTKSLKWAPLFVAYDDEPQAAYLVKEFGGPDHYRLTWSKEDGK